ncbi:hypothetical protein CEXT_694561 [Caerostris extrusa]|uniref:Uncharacterized protein n=1 Tax=Caerostris extrusa TaxID=172846 RepID=A0AAV4TZA3_CAEEX|nr:hypothetical protein CEXT_694561 [Caerostris extrusa]
MSWDCNELFIIAIGKRGGHFVLNVDSGLWDGHRFVEKGVPNSFVSIGLICNDYSEMYTRESANLHGSGILDLLTKSDKKINNTGSGASQHQHRSAVVSCLPLVGQGGGGVFLLPKILPPFPLS